MYNPTSVTLSLNQMVNRTLLHFYDLQQVVEGEGMAVVRMLDEKEERSLNVVVDEAMCAQLLIRTSCNPESKLMLPEVLLGMLSQQAEIQPLEATVYGIRGGRYLVMLLNRTTLHSMAIRISDAILLHIIGNVPFYIETQLMAKQCTEFNREAQGVGLPINTLDTPRLNDLLKKAISDENYELAAHVRDELRQRR